MLKTLKPKKGSKKFTRRRMMSSPVKLSRPIVPTKEVCLIDRLVQLRRLGSGAYGTVYKCRDPITQQFYAVKYIKIGEEQGVPGNALREVGLLRRVHTCPSIVQLVETGISKDYLVLVFECLDCDLLHYLDTLGGAGAPEKACQTILYQLLVSLEGCHSKRIIHRDIKPQNLLLHRSTMTMKLCDFGLARHLHNAAGGEMHDKVMTLWYRAPECLLGSKHYGTPVDIWSAGLIFAEMSRGRPLLKGENDEDQLLQLCGLFGKPTEETWPGVESLPSYPKKYPPFSPKSLKRLVPQMSDAGRALLKKLLELDPTKRISARDALADPYFSSIRTEEAKEATRIRMSSI